MQRFRPHSWHVWVGKDALGARTPPPPRKACIEKLDLGEAGRAEQFFIAGRTNHSVGLGEVQSLGDIGVLERDLTGLCARMQSKAVQVSFVYEAGPCGYGLHRTLTKKGLACMVCAPSLIARKPGDRVKTDRRAAIIMLVKALRIAPTSDPARQAA